MSKKVLGLLELLGYYLISFGLGLLPYAYICRAGVHPLVSILICDCIATVAIYLFGLLKKTPSVYDPYWSVQTFIIVVYVVIIEKSFHPIIILMMLPLLVYTVRLTAHFCGTFSGFDYVDWRYRNLRKKTGKFFQPVNFLGINLMPTLLVYAASVPCFLFALHGGAVYEARPTLTLVLSICFAVFSLGFVSISYFADIEMKSFIAHRADNTEVCQKGLWSFSRHPNYLGEIGFWWSGIFLLALFADFLWFIIAPVAVLILFLTYSIPAIEKRMAAHKPLYEDYKKDVSMLLILPRKKPRRKPGDYDSQPK